MKCRFCDGKGWWWNDDYGKPFKDACPRCGETGEVKTEEDE